MKSYGYLYVTASPHSLKFEFWPHTDGGQAQAFDPITVNLDTHVVGSG